jgi:hypothetical protein
VEGGRACRAVVPNPYWSNNLHMDLTPNRSLFTTNPPLRRHIRCLEKESRRCDGERESRYRGVRGQEWHTSGERRCCPLLWGRGWWWPPVLLVILLTGRPQRGVGWVDLGAAGCSSAVPAAAAQRMPPWPHRKLSRPRE